MQDRCLHILEAAVREFISTGEPVSSSQLFKKYDFGIKPAMIRAELAQLTEDGYLEQFYHSAGRVPSNQGYEFFAAQVMGFDDDLESPELANSFLTGELEAFLEDMSRELGLVTAVGTSDGEVIKEGLEPLMEHLAWGSREAMLQVIRDFEQIEERLGRIQERSLSDFLEVFIGRKSPVTESDELAVIAGDYELDNRKVVLVAIGPKRMNYEKATAIFKGLKKSQIK